jgi:hypothetical protein
LRLRHPFGAAALRRGASEPGLSLVLSSRFDRSVARPLAFSKNRHGRIQDSELFRHLFESVVARCIAEGLVGGETFASDASLIRADANKQYAAAKADWDPDRIDERLAPRAVCEYLDVLDDAAFGAASEVDPKFTSFADPASQWTGARKGPAFFAYSDSYLIDTDHGVILDIEATRSIRTAEVGATRTMIARTRERVSPTPERLAADMASATSLADTLFKSIPDRANRCRASCVRARPYGP